MARNIENLLNELRALKHGKKTLNHYQLLGLVRRAGYLIEVNGNGHNEIYRNNGTKLVNHEKRPVTFPNQKNDLYPGQYKKIIEAILDDLE